MIKLHYPDPGMTLHGENACKYLGFQKYDWKKDKDKPTMFWLYFEDDYKLLAQHTGKKYICWHGNDVRLLSGPFAKLLNIVRNPEIIHICLNPVLQAELFQLGIYSYVRFIFWGDVKKYKPEGKLTKDCYMSANKGRGIEYGEMIINSLAWKYTNWTFHIFGIDPTVPVYCDNVKYYGWIPEDEMDKITKNFGLCFRYNNHDGFPQVICKALLRNQFVITRLNYDKMTFVIRDVAELFETFESVNRWIEIPDLIPMREIKVRDKINNFYFLNGKEK